ncbi:hypothetical protein SeLEV6574_g01162 [Synchytrium endobioticum]|uniref:Lysosomal dipeptide transporter MFSD1 n=1 Tax=Synchytrium endobioticum TaxID=286115 RepID=A0A507DGJ3_9FUNG|nr:hypothetical protein SeLEV6574_g01162 [Synchytrium endobioticum]
MTTLPPSSAPSSSTLKPLSPPRATGTDTPSLIATLPNILDHDEIFASPEPMTPLQSNPSLRRLLARPRSSSLLRRSSSFGAAMVVLPPSQPELKDDEHHEKLASSLWRWMILLLCCLLLFGNYYAYDCIAALNKPLQEWLGSDYDTYQYQLNLLYSVYSFPNMFLPVLGGQLADKVDLKKVLILFSLFVCVGQTLFALGVSTRKFGLMVAGRVLFGIGGESISVVQCTITTSWFRGKELAFALGLNLCIARFGSVVNALASPRIEVISNVPTAVWAGTVMCYLSFVAALFLVFVMAHKTPQTPKEAPRRQFPTEVAQRRLSRGDSLSIPSVATPLIAKQLSYHPVNSVVTKWAQALADVKLLPFTFWLVCLICVLLYGTVVPFNNIVSDFLQSKWFPGDAVMAGNLMCIPDTMSAVLVPICGLLVDKYGHRASLLIICALVIAAVHFLLGLTMINPVIPLIFLGFSYSMYGVAIWPSIATIIQHEEEVYHQSHMLEPDLKLLGTAYGLSTSALNMALTVFPLISAQVRVWGGSFVMVEIFFASLAVGGAAASAVLYFVDARHGGVLEKPELIADEPDDEEAPLLSNSIWYNSESRPSTNVETRKRSQRRILSSRSLHPSGSNHSIHGGGNDEHTSSSTHINHREWLHQNSSTPRFTVEPDEDE